MRSIYHSRLPMKLIRTGLFVCALFVHQVSAAQVTLTMSNASAQACQGVLYDSGGVDGSGYSNNEDFTFTLCPDQPGGSIVFNFIDFELDQSGTMGNWDNLSFYDGSDTNAPFLGLYSGSQLEGLLVMASALNASGCLTLRFVSNAIGTGSFAASFSCNIPCDEPTAAATMSEDTPARICIGETLQFDGSGSQASTGQTIVSYEWRFGAEDTVITTGPTVEHSFGTAGGQAIVLVVTDANGCSSTNSVDLDVLVSTLPIFEFGPTDTLACLGTPLDLSAAVEAVPWISYTLDLGTGAYLPDNVGQEYDFGIELVGFEPGSTLTSTDDFSSVCVEMEHSFMGDLVLRLICPNGNGVTLHQQGGGPTYLGAPVDLDDGAPIFGQCGQYCWSPSATNGTMAENSASGLNTTQPAGTPTGASLVPDTYEAVGTWDALVGCPLNGTWRFRALDLWAGDNGYLCAWDLQLDPALDGTGLSFTPSFGPGCDSTFWSGPDITASSPDCNSIVATPTAVGDQAYTFTAINDHGCAFDTTITITVLDTGDPYCITLGVQDTAPSTITAFPMPVTDLLHVRHADPIDHYTLLDLRGRQILSGGAVADSAPLVVDMRHVPAGIYHLRLQGASTPVLLRVVKE